MKSLTLSTAIASIMLVSLCLGQGSSLATTLHSETVSGDLGQGGAAPSLSSVLGQNVVDGTISYTPTLLDIDAFTFSVGAERTASNFSFAFTNNSLISPEAVAGNVFVYTGTFVSGLSSISQNSFIVRFQGSPLGSTPSPLALSTLGSPLGPGQYSISIEPNGRSNNGGAVPYSLTFDVNAVPEPSTCEMLLRGLVLLGFAMRQRKQQPA